VEEIHFNEIKSLDLLKSIIGSFPILDCPKFQLILCLRQIHNLNTEDYIEKFLGPINKEKRRKFSNFNKRLRYGRQYACIQLGQEISNSPRRVYMDSDTADRPVRFTIWVTQLTFNIDIIGGIAIEYLSGRNVMFGKERIDSSQNSVHTFNLGDNEFITTVKLGSSDDLDEITFFSNLGKTYGPYGGDGGNNEVARPPGNNGYFYSLFAKDNPDGDGLCCLRLLWVYFSSEDVLGDYDMFDVDLDNDSDENIIFVDYDSDEDEHDTDFEDDS
jgi:hypothetical protein